MRGPDWLLVAVAILAIGASFVLHGSPCEFIGGNVEFPGPFPCIPIFPGPALIGLAVAALAVAFLGIRIRRRRISDM